MSERDSENSSFELRINQRNSQLIELQEQVNDKSLEITKLENKVGWLLTVHSNNTGHEQHFHVALETAF